MFGSQALETTIGLVLMFFIISIAASSIVELISQVAKKRARDLEDTVGHILSGTRDKSDKEFGDALNAFKGTSIYLAAQAGSRRTKKPSYISARAFAEAVGEMLHDGQGALQPLDNLPPGLKRRLDALARQPLADASAKLLLIKSGLEQWFDEAMGRLEGAYKRWVKWILLALGLLIAVVANASAFHTAERLWKDPVTRAAVANAANGVITDGGKENIKSVAEATDNLEALKIPVGWDQASRDKWKGKSLQSIITSWSTLAMMAGWLTTALLVTLGAPFWFDLLTRLVSLRSAGSKPPPASEDPASATRQQSATADATADVPRETTAGERTVRSAAESGPAAIEHELARVFGLAPPPSGVLPPPTAGVNE